MIDYFKALKIIFDNLDKHFYTIKTSNKNLLKTFNNLTSNNIYANKNIPSFINSAMDGYAIKYKETLSNNHNLKKFKIIKEIKAGEYTHNISLKKNCVIEIMTGARMPLGFDSVIKIEDTFRHKQTIILKKQIKKYENVRFIGEDFKKKDIILKKCEKITCNNIMALASFGIKKINIIKNPHIYLISTGNEITDIKKHFNPKFLIYNSSAKYFLALNASLSITSTYLGITKDDINDFLKKIKNILTINFISIFLTTGAVSKGNYDFIPKTLTRLGIKILFHSVNIKPGKPILFAKYKKHIFFFCLPGNPISSMVGYLFFVFPFIEYFLKQKLQLPTIAKITNKLTLKVHKHTFLKGYAFTNNSQIFVTISKNQESFKIKQTIQSNCFIFLKKNDIIKKNKLVSIYIYNKLNNIYD